MDKQITKKEFSIIARAKSFTHAWRGLKIFFKNTHNSWIQLVCASVVIFLGFHFCIGKLEWIAIVFAIGLALCAEALNTAFEIDIDLTSPTYHPYARDTKDVAAGAVLIADITALIIGIIVFAPYIFPLGF